jgi:hypothetical protein
LRDAFLRDDHPIIVKNASCTVAFRQPVDDMLTITNARLYPFLNKLVLLAGVGDLAKTRPPTDIVLLAPKAIGM